MLPIVGVFFLVVFGLVIASILLGMRNLEAQKRKKVAQILETRIISPSVQAESQVLLEPTRAEETLLTRLVQKMNLASQLETLIQQSGLDWNLNKLLLMMIGLAAVGVPLGLRFNVLMNPLLSAAAVGGVLGMVPYLYVKRQRAKRLDTFEEQFPEALDFLGRAMRAGHAFSIALEMLAEESPQPLGAEIRKVFNEQNLGLPVETALQNLARRVPLLDVSFFVSAVLLQKETGGNLSEILGKLAMIIRERFKLKGQVKAASAHGRITGTILTLMPVVLMVGLMLVAPTYLQSMADDPDGKYVIMAAIFGLILGHFVIKKIVNIKV